MSMAISPILSVTGLLATNGRVLRILALTRDV